MASRSGIARSEYSYNEKRQMTREAYFGLSGPAKGPAGKPPLTETQYDTAGHVIQIKETDLLGNVTIKQFDAHGKQTGESHQVTTAKPKPQPKPQLQPQPQTPAKPPAQPQPQPKAEGGPPPTA